MCVLSNRHRPLSCHTFQEKNPLNLSDCVLIIALRTVILPYVFAPNLNIVPPVQDISSLPSQLGICADTEPVT